MSTPTTRHEHTYLHNPGQHPTMQTKHSRGNNQTFWQRTCKHTRENTQIALNLDAPHTNTASNSNFFGVPGLQIGGCELASRVGDARRRFGDKKPANLTVPRGPLTHTRSSFCEGRRAIELELQPLWSDIREATRSSASGLRNLMSRDDETEGDR